MRFGLFGTGVILGLLLGAAAAEPAQGEPRPFAHEASDLPVRSEIVWGRLANGVRYVIWPLPKQEAVSLRLLIEAGSLNEEDGERGLAHFLEHMAFRGSERLAPDEMLAMMQRSGLAFGPHINAFTALDRTSYKLDLPRADAELIGKGLLVLREWAGRLTVPPEQIEPERGVVLSEMRLRDNQDLHEWMAGAGLIFGSWIENTWPVGRREVLETVQRDDFLRFYRRWYQPERTVVIVTGRADSDAIKRLIDTQFGDFTAAGTAGADPDFPPLAVRGPAIRLVPEQTAVVRIAVLTAEPIERFRDDFANRQRLLKLGLAQNIVRRRLVEHARAANGIFAVRGVGNIVNFERVRVGYVELTTSGDHWREGIAALEQELRRALARGFTQQEVLDAKRETRKGWEQLIANDGATKPPVAADRLVEAVRSDLTVNDPKPVIERLAATLDSIDGSDLQHALRDLWVDGDRRWLLNGPLGDVDEPVVAKVLEESERVAVTPADEPGKLRFAYESFGIAGEVVERTEMRPGLTIATFANGVRLVVFTTADPSVRLHVGIDLLGGGRAAQPPGQDGLIYLAGRNFIAGGLSDHTIEDVNRFLRRHGTGINFRVNETRFSFTSTAPRDDVEAALRVAAAYLSAPGFRSEAFAQAMGSLDRVRAEFKATPEAVIANELPRRHCAGDPRCGVAELAELRSRRWDEAKAWLGPALAEAPLIVTVVGPADGEAVVRAVAATLGALPPRRPIPAAQLPVEFLGLPAGSRETLNYTNPGKSAFAIVEWPVPSARDYALRLRQGLVARLFQWRLFDELRREHGETYSPRAFRFGSMDVNPNWLRASVDVKPEKAAEIARRIAAIAAAVGERPFTASEFERVAPVMATELSDRLKSDGDVLEVLRARLDPATALDELLSARATVERTPLEDVNALAREVLTAAAPRTYLVVPDSTTTAR